MGKAIVITSGKGGAGKSTLTANLGIRLAIDGYKTLLIDTDIGLRNLDILLGMEDKIVYDIVDVCTEACDIKKAVLKDKRYENLSLIPAAQAKDKEAITPLQLKNMVGKIKDSFDYILIDCPAGIGRGFENAVLAADCAIVVSLPERASLRDADRVAALLEENDISDVKFVINRVRQKMIDKGFMPTIEEMMDIMSIDLLGVVPEDEEIIKRANHASEGLPDENAKSTMAYKNIAKRLGGEKVDLVSLRDNRNVFVRIMEAIRN